MIEPEHPHLPVGRQCLRAKDFGEAASAVAPLQFHLEQAILRMRKPKPERGILVIGGSDQRHAIGVARNVD